MNDEFNGVGGSYVVDPKTGKRTRVQDAEPSPAALPSPSGRGAGGEGKDEPAPEKPTRKGAKE